MRGTYSNRQWRKNVMGTVLLIAASLACGGVQAAKESKNIHHEVGGLFIPVSRSELVIVPHDIAQVLVADPDIADVHVIGSKHVAFIGKRIGRTNAKLFDKKNKIIRQFDVVVGYDLPAIRKALHFFLPKERIGVELVNTSIALTGEVSDAAAADKALRVVDEFVRPQTSASTGASPTSTSGSTASQQLPATGSTPIAGAPTNAGSSTSGASGTSGTASPVLNLMKVASGQQVMLHVRVGEIERTALKNLGFDLNLLRSGSSATIIGGTMGGINRFITSSTSSGTSPSATLGSDILTTINPSDTGVLSGLLNSGSLSLSATLEALETEGVFRVLAEPDLVAISGEKAEFLAGGEFPIPVPQIGGGVAVTTVQFKDFGVAVQFIPYVLSENRIRIAVQPEVSEINTALATTVNGNTIPALNTRRAKTTVELAPGESFMIAGLLQDRLNSNISQVPGASEIPILGALLRSTSYNRDETELVIAVTPYLVDPLKSSDVRLPTDDFRPASLMEQFFYGALGSMSGNTYRLSQTPSLEGPLGFMTD